MIESLCESLDRSVSGDAWHGPSLQAILAAFPEERLAEMVGPARDAPLGSGVTFAVMLVGLVEHNAYHGGQIALLKRALRRAP